MKIKTSFDEIFSMEALREALYHAAKGRRYNDDVLDYELNWYPRLSELQKEIYSGKYSVDIYHVFFIREPKKRMIMSIDFKHRIVQWALYQALMPQLAKGYIEDTYGCIPGRGAEAAVKRLRYWLDNPHNKHLYYLKMDISKYFYRVNHEVLKALYRKKIADKRVCGIIDSIIDCKTTPFGLPKGKRPEEVPLKGRLYDKGMPIGNLMSQISANLYLNELDQYCKRVLQIHMYERYMDDVIILWESKEQLQKWLSEIEIFITTELKLDLNKKTCIRPVSQGISFIGYRIWPHYTTIRKSSTLHMKRYLEYLMVAYSTGKRFIDDIRPVYMCYKARLDKCDCKQLKHKILDEFVLQKDKYGNVRRTDYRSGKYYNPLMQTSEENDNTFIPVYAT